MTRLQAKEQASASSTYSVVAILAIFLVVIVRWVGLELPYDEAVIIASGLVVLYSEHKTRIAIRNL